MVISIVGDRVGGVFHRGEELQRITELKLDTDYEPGTNYHCALRAEVTLADGTRHRLEGRVRGFIPLRNRRAGQHTHIGEGMTEYRSTARASATASRNTSISKSQQWTRGSS